MTPAAEPVAARRLEAAEPVRLRLVEPGAKLCPGCAEDELAARVRSLEAERLRPTPPPPGGRLR